MIRRGHLRRTVSPRMYHIQLALYAALREQPLDSRAGAERGLPSVGLARHRATSARVGSALELDSGETQC